MISRRAKRLTLGFSFLLLLVVLLLFSVHRYFSNREAKRRYEEEQAKIRPRELYTVKAERRDEVRTRRYGARVAPWIDAQVSAEVMGKVEQVFVDPGSEVKKGDRLVKLDERMAVIELASADAALASAQVESAEARRLLEEAEQLARRNVISSTEMKAREASTEARAAEEKRLIAERDRLAELLDRHTIRAPFDGVVRARSVDVGDVVAANGPVVDLVKLNPLRVIFFVSEFEVASFQKGETIKLTIAGMDGKTFDPELTNVSRSADPQTHLFQIEARLENPRNEILGGSQGIVEAKVANYSDALFVPATAVHLSGTRALVEVPTKDGATRVKEIQIGQEVDGSYPVVSGLDAGDEVVVR
jgi:membrane fusion protein (multidrug efflux system)